MNLGQEKRVEKKRVNVSKFLKKKTKKQSKVDF